MSDPRDTGLHSAEDVTYVLSSRETVAEWVAILEALALVLSAQGHRRSIPSIDHGRIDGFLREWQDDEYRERAPAEFLAAVQAFETAWAQAGASAKF